MRKDTTSRTHLQEKAQALKAAVLKLLQCTEMQYNQLQYEQGLAYLNTYLNGDAYMVQVMERSRIFWSWWRNHWTNRDATFMALHEKHPLRRAEIARQLYEQYNRGRLLANSIQPNAVVLTESYSEMIGELIEEQR
jgi:hypothetical protein